MGPSLDVRPTPRPDSLLPMPDRTPSSHDALVARVVGSAAFARSRARSAAMLDDPAALQALCTLAEEHLAHIPLDEATGVSPDRLGWLVCECLRIARRHADDLASHELSHEEQGTLHLTRVRLLLAAIDFFVSDDDVVPDHHRHGLLDDLIVLEWALSGMGERVSA